MPNFDGQYEIEAAYTVTISSRTFTHKFTFDVILATLPVVGGDPYTDMEVQTKGFGHPSLGLGVDTMFGEVWDLMGTGTSQPVFTLWQYDPEPSVEKTFITSWSSLETFDLGEGAAVAAHQSTYTFRSQNGGYGRIQLMEDIVALETKVLWPSTGEAGDLRTHILGANSIIVARDGGYPIAAMNASYGQNEVLKRKRFRSE